jgi:DNA-binding transcriptional MerR regulator
MNRQKSDEPNKAAVRLHIGAFAAKTGHSIHTIRWYESQGLLPRVLRDAGGKRIYSKRHLTWLELLDRLRHSGMSIAQLREYTKLAQQGGATVVPTLAVLVKHRQSVADKIAEWEQAMVLINQKIDFYANWKALGKQPKPG